MVQRVQGERAVHLAMRIRFGVEIAVNRKPRRDLVRSFPTQQSVIDHMPAIVRSGLWIEQRRVFDVSALLETLGEQSRQKPLDHDSRRSASTVKSSCFNGTSYSSLS